MRNLTAHMVEGDSVNHQLEIRVLDEPGPGGANHRYLVIVPESGDLAPVGYGFYFQHGPIEEAGAGVNGITDEALLAIVIDRLEGFQAGPFASEFNVSALDHCRIALNGLQHRTRERLARGVEGTYQK